MCKDCHLLHMNKSSHCSEPEAKEPHPPDPKDQLFTARLKLQIFLDQRIRDIGTVAAWKSRRNGDREIYEAQQACARELVAVRRKLASSGKMKP
ncbi:MAG: hypothetical protein LQ339_001819 [Xanthoria mediterranea]|nr:MAG: hypothetical protein LQ339_001819 [Xanthoria mediterranea]